NSSRRPHHLHRPIPRHSPRGTPLKSSPHLHRQRRPQRPKRHHDHFLPPHRHIQHEHRAQSHPQHHPRPLHQRCQRHHPQNVPGVKVIRRNHTICREYPHPPLKKILPRPHWNQYHRYVNNPKNQQAPPRHHSAQSLPARPHFHPPALLVDRIRAR